CICHAADISNEESHMVASGNIAETSHKPSNNIRPNDNRNRMIVGGSNLTFITKIGNMPLTEYLTLFDVLVVPEYCVSLMHVHKRKSVGTGRQFGGLYYFDGNQGRELESSCIHNVYFLSKYTWHCRLGHPADQVLNVLKPNLLFDNDKSDVMCDICQRARQAREPFPLSDHVSTEIGELIHLDLWGHIRSLARLGMNLGVFMRRDGFRYFITIVDDFSRVVWVFLLKN
ncbi:ribonuclease H-like domain-containing protein, partial [Tanacetum coccineum]